MAEAAYAAAGDTAGLARCDLVRGAWAAVERREPADARASTLSDQPVSVRDEPAQPLRPHPLRRARGRSRERAPLRARRGGLPRRRREPRGVAMVDLHRAAVAALTGDPTGALDAADRARAAFETAGDAAHAQLAAAHAALARVQAARAPGAHGRRARHRRVGRRGGLAGLGARDRDPLRPRGLALAAARRRRRLRARVPPARRDRRSRAREPTTSPSRRSPTSRPRTGRPETSKPGSRPPAAPCAGSAVSGSDTPPASGWRSGRRAPPRSPACSPTRRVTLGVSSWSGRRSNVSRRTTPVSRRPRSSAPSSRRTPRSRRRTGRWPRARAARSSTGASSSARWRPRPPCPTSERGRLEAEVRLELGDPAAAREALEHHPARSGPVGLRLAGRRRAPPHDGRGLARGARAARRARGTARRPAGGRRPPSPGARSPSWRAPRTGSASWRVRASSTGCDVDHLEHRRSLVPRRRERLPPSALYGDAARAELEAGAAERRLGARGATPGARAARRHGPPRRARSDATASAPSSSASGRSRPRAIEMLTWLAAHAPHEPGRRARSRRDEAGRAGDGARPTQIRAGWTW